MGRLTSIAVLAATLLTLARPATGQTERPTGESTLFLEAAGSALCGLRVFGDLDDHDFPPGWSLVAAWRATFGRLALRAGVTSLVSDPVDLGDRDTRRLWPLASVGWSLGSP